MVTQKVGGLVAVNIADESNDQSEEDRLMKLYERARSIAGRVAEVVLSKQALESAKASDTGNGVLIRGHKEDT